MVLRIPSSHVEWASLDWQEAQQAVGLLLHQEGKFMMFEEKRLSTGKRADVLVIRNTADLVTFGIAEVKCYKQVTTGLLEKTLEQACGYLRTINSNLQHTQRYGNKAFKYFVALVFTKDYPIFGYQMAKQKINSLIPSELHASTELIITTPDDLIRKLKKVKMIPSRQSDLHEFLQ